MDIQHRMTDVSTLQCKVCQAYLEMILVPDWQSKLYDKAKRIIEGKLPFAEKYLPAYEGMRDKEEIEAYKVSCMDVTMISTIVQHCGEICVPSNHVRNAIKQLTADRNIVKHQNSNEESDELYLTTLLDLYNLRTFVQIVDRYELSIPSEDRLAFRREYLPQINALMRKLDDERFKLIGMKKQMDDDITQILESLDPMKEWLRFWKIYDERSRSKRDRGIIDEFCVRASDAGVLPAHSYAACLFMVMEKNYAETERRLCMILEGYNDLPYYQLAEVIQDANALMNRGYSLSEGFRQLLEGIKSEIYTVKKNEDGTYRVE